MTQTWTCKKWYARGMCWWDLGDSRSIWTWISCNSGYGKEDIAGRFIPTMTLANSTNSTVYIYIYIYIYIQDLQYYTVLDFQGHWYSMWRWNSLAFLKDFWICFVQDGKPTVAPSSFSSLNFRPAQMGWSWWLTESHHEQKNHPATGHVILQSISFLTIAT